ncbi:MAG: hypothetical protein V9F82_00180 [Dermatophilaceae bacterium]
MHGTNVAATKAASGARAVAEAWERAAELRKEREAELRRAAEPVIHDDPPASDGAIVAAALGDEDTPDAPVVLTVEPRKTPPPPVLEDEAPKKRGRRKPKEETPVTPGVSEVKARTPEPVVALEAVVEPDEKPARRAKKKEETPPPPPEEPEEQGDVGPQIVDHVAEVVPEKPAAPPRPSREAQKAAALGFRMPESMLLDPAPATIVREDRDALLGRAKEAREDARRLRRERQGRGDPPGPDGHDLRGRRPPQGTKVIEGRGPRRRSRARPLAQGAHHRADPRQEPHRLRDPERASACPSTCASSSRTGASMEMKAPLPVRARARHRRRARTSPTSRRCRT